MKKVLARLVVLLRAVPTWATIGALAAPIVAEELSQVLPAPWSERVTALGLTVAGALGAIVTIVRRVTPVVESQRGILPPGESHRYRYPA